MNDTQLNNRQLLILDYLIANPTTSRQDLSEKSEFQTISRITLIRDLNLLIEKGWVNQGGGGKYVTYSLNPHKSILVPLDLNEYFNKNQDTRYARHLSFNPSVINDLSSLFTPSELNVFEEGRRKLTSRLASVNETIIKRELERFIIEFSWKSSQIEGNTYSLLETEELIKNRREAKGHDINEATMILNHKTTFDTILSQKNSFKNLSEIDIRTIHSELTKNMEISSGIREYGVGITGTKYLPLDNKWQIEEALHKILDQLSKIQQIPEKSLILLAMISYLQPFSDGNKRTARMLSNAILLANGYYPLSYRSVDEVEFKKALIVFYEQNNLYHLKRIFLEQQKFAIDNYFL
jgi:fido (protein-threonine AMPylation protein)